MYKQFVSIFVLATIFGVSRSFIVFDIDSNDDACSLCTRNFGHGLNNQTLSDILQKLEQVAEKMPGHIGVEVKVLLQTFGPEIIRKLLDKYGAKDICTHFFHLCANKEILLAPHLAMFAQYDEDQSAKCLACKIGVGVLDSVLGSADIQKELQRLIQDACDKAAAGAGKTICNLVASFLPEAMAAMAGTLTVNEICYGNAVCKS